MDISKLVGIGGIMIAGLMGYWLVTPSNALNSDPANSIILMTISLLFAGSGIFLLFFGYSFNSDEGD
jgi:hypothetical protein